MEERTVRIGDRDLRIARFKGLKAVLAGALVARVMREMPQIQERVNQFTIDYRRKNTTVLTPAMAKLPRFAILGLTTEDFEAVGGKMEFPDEPTGNQIAMAVLPDLFELARKELQRFIGLIAIPNSELEQADDADGVEAALDNVGKALFREGDIDELLELLAVGWEVVQDQVLSKRDKLGKLLELPFLRMLLSTPPETEQPNGTQPMYQPDVPSSFTDSESPTDGVDEQLSMASLGKS